MPWQRVIGEVASCDQNERGAHAAFQSPHRIETFPLHRPTEPETPDLSRDRVLEEGAGWGCASHSFMRSPYTCRRAQVIR